VKYLLNFGSEMFKLFGVCGLFGYDSLKLELSFPGCGLVSVFIRPNPRLGVLGYIFFLFFQVLTLLPTT
jgi:hypothetical protein